MSLTWGVVRRDYYLAPCGSRRQGRARVWLCGEEWRWSLDMLPDDSEPVIRSTCGFATAEEAMRMAEAQEELWPVLVRDAER